MKKIIKKFPYSTHNHFRQYLIVYLDFIITNYKSEILDTTEVSNRHKQYSWTVFSVITPCNQVGYHQHFRGTCCYIFRVAILKMKALGSSKH